jgi:hypothetical protein
VLDEQAREPRAKAPPSGRVAAKPDAREQMPTDDALGRHGERREHDGEAGLLERVRLVVVRRAASPSACGERWATSTATLRFEIEL